MSRINGGKLALGAFLMASFIAVLVVIFMPLFEGDNALNYLDNLYNSISKDSAYYIPKVQHEVEELGPQAVTLTLRLEEEEIARQAVTVLEEAGAEASAENGAVTVSGDLTALLAASLEDADAMYHNRGEELEARYGMPGRVALLTWWASLGAMERDLKRQKRFGLAETVHTVQAKTVECAYNYYGIEPQPIGERWGIVVLSLAFYVLYTVWYGYAVMFLFEGLGFSLSH